MNKKTSGAARKSYGPRLAISLAILGAMARLIPHPANMTPVGATSLFAGARVRGWTAYLVPLILMGATDPLLAAIYGYPLFGATTPLIYGAFLMNVWIGRKLLGKCTAARVGAASALCSLQFFLLTNLGVWLWGGLYPRSGAGLAACYLAALPFLGRTLLGDLAYSGLLFGLDAVAGRLRSASRRQAVESPAA
ncbi:MAG TPA: DUF6580 family putative transport protein [Terriglobia bacterium]|nr:DUF6580 family putative transport protein [Terriglobia bacterium]